MNPNTSVTKFLRYGFRDAQTRSQTDTPEDSMHPAPKVFGGGDRKFNEYEN